MARYQLYYHLRWSTDGQAQTLTRESIARLDSYITRYAQTLGFQVHAVGGMADHVHIVVQAPPERPMLDVIHELRRATTRFGREGLALPGFAWDEAEQLWATVSPEDLARLLAYVDGQAARHAEGDVNLAWENQPVGEPETVREEPPTWLREAMEKNAEPDRR